MERSKASMLAWLAPRVGVSVVPEVASFTVERWRADAAAVVGMVAERFGGRRVAVRSSAVGEDGVELSAAGAFASVLGVPASDGAAVGAAVGRVVESYARDGGARGVRDDDEVLVQEMVEGVVLSGVVFTHDLDSGAPYLVVNYDDVSGRTDTVTSGDGAGGDRTLYVHRGARGQVRSARFGALLDAVAEVEGLLDSEFLDIEFAMGADLVVRLLQVRAITTQPNWNRATARRVDATLAGISRFVGQRLGPAAGVWGRTTVLGQMPDWNPAEMIGRAPRALALSLYRRLITDDAWRVARERMGYAVPTGQPLLVSLAGQPFVDTRLSFHSLLPASLPAEVGARLVDVWVQRLAARPELHDKVEFEVAVTAYRFDLPEQAGELTGGVLSASEQQVFVEAVRDHTVRQVVGDAQGSLADAEGMIAELQRRQEDHRRLAAEASPGALLPVLIDDVVRFGTVPFAMLARHAFVARTLLDSLATVGAVSAERVAAVKAGVRTVAGDLVEAMHALESGGMARSAFLERYGFLRPGTYDLLSQRYDQMEVFTRPHVAWGQATVGREATVDGQAPRRDVAAPDAGLPGRAPAASEEGPQGWSEDERRAVEACLAAHGLVGLDADGLLAYARRAIAGREFAKFVFTQTVSEVLETVAVFGRRHHLSREELSHLRIGDIIEAVTDSHAEEVEDVLRARSVAAAAAHEVTAAVRLPQVLFDTAGVQVVPFQTAEPNFITSRQVTAATVQLGRAEHTDGADPAGLAGRVVLIEGADPGYDWIFAYPIAGLVTKYGGANSHMAIRCAEFGLPAAIGCGEQIFEALTATRGVALDCAARLVQPLSTVDSSPQVTG